MSHCTAAVLQAQQCRHAAAHGTADSTKSCCTHSKQVHELNAQLDGGRGGSGNAFSSPAHLDALVGHEAEGEMSTSPTTPDGQNPPRPAAATYTPEVEQCVREVRHRHMSRHRQWLKRNHGAPAAQLAGSSAA